MVSLGNDKDQTAIFSLDIILLYKTGGVPWKSVFSGACTVPAHSAGSVPTSINCFLIKRSKFFTQPQKKPYHNSQL